MRPRWGLARPCAHPRPRSAGEPPAAPFARRLAGRLPRLSRSARPPLPRASPVVIHTRSHHCRRARRRRRGGRPASSAPLRLWIRAGASPLQHRPGVRRALLGRRCRVTRSFFPHSVPPSALRAVLRRACRRAGWPLPSCFVRRIVAACTSAGPGTAPPAVLSGAAPRAPWSAARQPPFLGRLARALPGCSASLRRAARQGKGKCSARLAARKKQISGSVLDRRKNNTRQAKICTDLRSGVKPAKPAG